MAETHSNTERSGPTATGCSGSRINRMMRVLSPWTTLFIGATTIVFTEAVVERLPFTDFYTAVATFFVALILLYGQVGIAYYLTERGRE